jgi:crossover junction endodeoxyribonuclease RuvC
MRILGIDPGTVTTGYGVVQDVDGAVTAVDFGAIGAPARSPIGERLSYIYSRLLQIISQHHPDVLAVEQPFVGKNIKSALAIGRSQAIAILAAAGNGIPVFEYTPAQVKQQVSNFGAGSKEQIQEMVRLQLDLPEIPGSNDAADALAVALCHSSHVRLIRILDQSARP